MYGLIAFALVYVVVGIVFFIKIKKIEVDSTIYTDGYSIGFFVSGALFGTSLFVLCLMDLVAEKHRRPTITVPLP